MEFDIFIFFSKNHNVFIIKINICPFNHIDLPSTSQAYSECWLLLGISWLGIYVPYIWRVYFGSINYISVWKWQRRGLPAELIETFSYTQYVSIKNQTCEEKARNLQNILWSNRTIFLEQCQNDFWNNWNAYWNKKCQSS